MQPRLSSCRGQRALMSNNSQHVVSQSRIRCLTAGIRARAEASTATKKHSKNSHGVAVELANTSFSSRKLNATVQIAAPLEVVWDALTDYDKLGTFIPSLVENKCLERRPRGCLLYQVGAQDVAMGVKFSAACTLEIQEYPTGIPDSLCTVDGDWNAYFPAPISSRSSGSSGSSRSSISTTGSSSSGSSSESETAAAPSGQIVRDISFSLVEGDFQAFKGIWRLQPGPLESLSTILTYSLFVKPHPWLPVGLIQNRISSEVVNNLTAVRRHAEHVHRHQLKQQQLLSESLSSASMTNSSTTTTEADESSTESNTESMGQ